MIVDAGGGDAGVAEPFLNLGDEPRYNFVFMGMDERGVLAPLRAGRGLRVPCPPARYLTKVI